MKWDMLVIVLLVLLSLLPFYWLYGHLEKMIQPRRSGGRFVLWMLLVFFLVFMYTFLGVYGFGAMFQPSS